jgi:hypothetical protein
VKLPQFWQQLMLRLALRGAVLAVCVMWGGLVAPVSAESTALVRIIHASPGTGSVNVFVNGSKVSNNLQFASVTITDNASDSPQSVALSGTGVPGAPGTGSDPHAQPPAGTTQQGPLGWLALLGAVVAAAGLGTALISGRLRRSRPR